MLRISEVLDLAERILACEEDIIVPVEKLWAKTRDELPAPDFPSLEYFIRLLKSDSRFELMPPLKDELSAGRFGEEFAKEIEALERMALYRGPRVKLRGIELTGELLVQIIKRKMQETLDALKGAQESPPPSDSIDTEI
jgi:hypothetical protein